MNDMKPLHGTIKKELLDLLEKRSKECEFYMGAKSNGRVRCLMSSGRPSATFCLYNCVERK